MLNKRLQEVKARIARACEKSGRSPDEIELIAVTKYVGADAIAQALESGCRHIGENRVRDALEKRRELAEKYNEIEGTWHFIGHLQSNKAKDVVRHFEYLHSLDRMSLAEQLQKEADKTGVTVKCFIQVNVSGETTKHGIAPDMLLDFVRGLRAFDRLEIVGLMTMAPFVEDPELARPVFAGLRELRDRLNEADIFASPVRHLSMGMSNDFEVAIEEGATWVRLGSILLNQE